MLSSVMALYGTRAIHQIVALPGNRNANKHSQRPVQLLIRFDLMNKTAQGSTP